MIWRSATSDFIIDYRDYCAFASEVSIGFAEVPFIRQVFNIDGKVRYSRENLSGAVARGSYSGILPAGIPLRARGKCWSPPKAPHR
jgi:hypothetical protein